MAKRKKRSKIVPVLKFVGFAAVGGIIGAYGVRYWDRKVAPRLGGPKREELPEGLDEPYENPSAPSFAPAMPNMTFVQPPAQIMPILPFPQFTPQPYTPPPLPGVPTAPATSAASAASAPSPESRSKAEQIRERRLRREAEARALLDQVERDLEDEYEVGR